MRKYRHIYIYIYIHTMPCSYAYKLHGHSHGHGIFILATHMNNQYMLGCLSVSALRNGNTEQAFTGRLWVFWHPGIEDNCDTSSPSFQQFFYSYQKSMCWKISVVTVSVLSRKLQGHGRYFLWQAGIVCEMLAGMYLQRGPQIAENECTTHRTHRTHSWTCYISKQSAPSEMA